MANDPDGLAGLIQDLRATTNTCGVLQRFAFLLTQRIGFAAEAAIVKQWRSAVKPIQIKRKAL